MFFYGTLNTVWTTTRLWKVKTMQVINKTGFFNSSEARTAKNRYGVSIGKSFLGLHFAKKSFYVETFKPANKFGKKARPSLNIKQTV